MQNQMQNQIYEQKYLKYKNKYLSLKENLLNQSGSGKKFFHAIIRGDLNLIHEKLTIPHGFPTKHLADPNQLYKEKGPYKGKTALVIFLSIISARLLQLNLQDHLHLDYYEVIKLLIDHNADPNIFPDDNNMPLFMITTMLLNYPNIGKAGYMIFSAIDSKTYLGNQAKVYNMISDRLSDNSPSLKENIDFLNKKFSYSVGRHNRGRLKDSKKVSGTAPDSDVRDLSNTSKKFFDAVKKGNLKLIHDTLNIHHELPIPHLEDPNQLYKEEGEFKGKTALVIYLRIIHSNLFIEHDFVPLDLEDYEVIKLLIDYNADPNIFPDDNNMPLFIITNLFFSFPSIGKFGYMTFSLIDSKTNLGNQAKVYNMIKDKLSNRGIDPRFKENIDFLNKKFYYSVGRHNSSHVKNSKQVLGTAPDSNVLPDNLSNTSSTSDLATNGMIPVNSLTRVLPRSNLTRGPPGSNFL